MPAAAASSPSIPAPSPLAVAEVAPATSPVGGREPLAVGGVRALLVQAFRLWGVTGDLSADAVRAWPTASDGSLQMEAVARQYQLTATFLPRTTLGEIRGIGLPALIELSEPPGKSVYLLRRIEGPAVVLLAPAGEDRRLSRERFESGWTHSAWVLWRNIDDLPGDPVQAMTPTVVATLALRLQKLGYLQGPLPEAYGERLEQAVRLFQRDAGLVEDGFVGPRTTLALARVAGGRFSPRIAEPAAR
jgi:hypothetical protein